MSEKHNYQEIIERARARKRKSQQHMAAIKAVGIGAAILVLAASAAVFFTRSPESSDTADPNSPEAANDIQEEQDMTQAVDAAADIVLPEEELAQAREEVEKQAVVDSYTNLGLVQVSGYLNIRSTPEPMGEIIGKLQQNSACEIIDTEGEWYHISSGGIEGYIHSQYVLTGDEARAKAIEYAIPMAIVNAEKLNIRSDPSLDPLNVIGQALANERYALLETSGEWLKIPEGYISSEFVEIRYALNEARKLDLKAMALNQYDNLVISKVSDYLNIRKEPSTDDNANIIGKFPGRAAGEILETLDGWYKIHSGPITGYITADPQYVATGQEARDLAMEAAQLMAVVNADMLNVRSEPNTESKIWTQISKEERYGVLEQLDGWVEIELDTGDSESSESPDKAFISTRDNNVDVRYALAEAIKFSPLEEKANQAASMRSKLVNYALQFVGGRYLWGGTNPNTGADCSGFVQYVYRNMAGISLPRTSREQAKTGRSVSSGEMQPGDLIFYTNSGGTVNHVAMYIGNGQIVHAASRRSGIKISTWNYRRPKTIRRYLD